MPFIDSLGDFFAWLWGWLNGPAGSPWLGIVIVLAVEAQYSIPIVRRWAKRAERLRFYEVALLVATLGLTVYSVVAFLDRQFNLGLALAAAGLGTVLLAKGIQFFIVAILVPFLKALPGGVGTWFAGKVAGTAWDRWRSRNKPPTSASAPTPTRSSAD